MKTNESSCEDAALIAAPLDRDGFPPCTMTVDQMCAHIRETFGSRDFRIVAFRIRGYAPGGTLTTKRGEMNGIRANKVQVAACERALHDRMK